MILLPGGFVLPTKRSQTKSRKRRRSLRKFKRVDYLPNDLDRPGVVNGSTVDIVGHVVAGFAADQHYLTNILHSPYVLLILRIISPC